MSENTQNIQNTENASIKVIDEQPTLKVVSKVEKPKPKPEPEPKWREPEPKWREPETPICGHCGRHGADGVVNYWGTTVSMHSRCMPDFRDSI